MLDPITLKLNVDPLILSALSEDINNEDVSTNSVMPENVAGQVDLICKEDGIICGLPVFERVFYLLDPTTTFDVSVKLSRQDNIWEPFMVIFVSYCQANVRLLTICNV